MKNRNDCARLPNFLEMLMALVSMGILLLLCMFISHDWLTYFYLAIQNLHKVV